MFHVFRVFFKPACNGRKGGGSRLPRPSIRSRYLVKNAKPQRRQYSRSSTISSRSVSVGRKRGQTDRENDIVCVMQEEEVEMRPHQAKMWYLYEVATRLRVPGAEEELGLEEAEYEGIGSKTWYALD